MAEPRITTTLAASPLFAGLQARDVARVAGFCRHNSYKKGNIVFVEGDFGASFYVVATGRIKVFKGSPDGREVIIKVMDQGDMLGEAAALVGKPYPASAQALTDATAIEIPRREFAAFLKEEPGVALRLISALSERLQQVSGTLEKLTLKEVPGRLAAYLLDHAQTGPKGLAVDLTVPKQALAAELGTVPEVLSRALRKLIGAGFIAADGSSIVLADEKALRALADGIAK